MICLLKFKPLNRVGRNQVRLCYPGDVSIWDWTNINAFQIEAESEEDEVCFDEPALDALAALTGGIIYIPPSHTRPLSYNGRAFEIGVCYYDTSEGASFLFVGRGWELYSSAEALAPRTAIVSGSGEPQTVGIVGDIYYDTVAQLMYYYTDEGWSMFVQGEARNDMFAQI